jgi:hypothetical protein
VRPLSRRTLNRTVLHRQLLVERTVRPVADVVAHLVAVQAQEPNWPYLGLWSRLAGFTRPDLDRALRDGGVVRGSLLRATQHLVCAEDHRWIRPLVQPVLDQVGRSRYFTEQLDGLDLAALEAAGRDLLADRTLSRPELGKLLVERFPGRSGSILAAYLQIALPVVHPPPDGGWWGRWGNRAATPVAVAGAPLDAAPRPSDLVTRYLAAFGPASVADVQAWSGLTRLREVVDGMPSLRRLRDEAGRELVDLPDAPLADPDEPVPARLLPGYDNLLVGYADRTRVAGDDDRRLAITGGLVRATVLVDGFVAGTWSVGADGTVSVAPFRPLSADEDAAVRAEVARAEEFVAAAGRGPQIR